jgi:hypothetical protein
VNPAPRQAVTAFGALRIGLGVAFLAAPRRLSRGEDVLMTRGFAVRELVLGMGGVMGVSRGASDWARLGALVDLGDAAAAAIAMRRRVPMASLALLAALGGLAVETWAFRELTAPGARAYGQLGAGACGGGAGPSKLLR